MEARPSKTILGIISRSGSRLSSLALLLRAKAGDASAVSRLFRRLLPELRRWAHGRLPGWARRRVDTDDLVQDSFLHLHRHLKSIEPRRRDVLAAYLRQSIRNRIRDEIRRAGQVELSGVAVSDPADWAPSPAEESERRAEEERYRQGLERLSQQDRELIVGRLEMGYSYQQLALATGRETPDAARVAVRRALLRLADTIND